MRVRVLLFAALRERAGCECEDIDLPGGSTLGDAVAWMQRRHRFLGMIDSSIRYARNLENADLETGLSEGDEIALIPAVSGR